MTAQLAPVPVFKGWDNNGNPLANGQLFTYQAGTSTPQATYTDASQGQQQTNPVVLNARGEASVWLDPTLTYKLTLADSVGNLIWTQDQIVGGYIPVTQLASYVTQSFIGQTLYPRTAVEIAAGVTPTSYNYPQGAAQRYGAVFDGTTDDTTALQNWVKIGGALTFPAATSKIIAELSVPSNTQITFAKGGGISQASNDIAIFRVKNGNNVVITGGTFSYGAPMGGSIGYTVGGVVFDNSSNCQALNNTFSAMQWSGVTVYASSNCVVRGNYFTNFTTTVNDSADVAVISSPSTPSAYNIVEGNFCFGGAEHGITLEDPYNFVSCSRNIVLGNKVGQHTRYGILIYQPSGGDSFNQVIGNHVEGILGSVGDRSSGNGIYLSNGVGGSLIANNTIRNCCINSNSASLAPAGIGVNSPPSVDTPLTITGNIIEGMTQFWGILVAVAGCGATVTGNVVRMPAVQGANIGGAIRVANSNNVSVTGNSVTLLTTTQNQDGITAIAQGAACTNVAITGNTVNGGHLNQIRIAQTSGNVVTGVTITGNICNGGDSSCIPLSLDNTAAARVNIEGNQFVASGSVSCISVTAATSLRIASNLLSNAGGAAFTSSGSCTGSTFVQGQINAGQVSNGATGLICETLQTAQPASGTYAVGDIVRNSSPTAAGVLYWVCTTAGTPGTWKTVSNT